ncbi:MAG: VWA domain-containing protein [Candidatus Binataceae bacterium]|nr:VWA domain-containing protein [Candidatus Binataceae bacterium]
MLLVLVLASCASLKSNSQTYSYSTTAKPPPPVFAAPPAIAGKPGYREAKVSVENRSGTAIPDIRQADFIADLSGVQVPIAFFRHNPRAPISIGILVDSSGSMEPKLDTVKRELAGFIGGLDPADELYLIAFTYQPILLQPLTTDHQAVVQSLAKLRAFGQTALYDSIVSGVGVFGKGPNAKAILLITDGMDNTSTATEQDAIDWLTADSVRIYAIGIGSANIATSTPANASGPGTFGDINSVDAKALQDMARDAGGAVFIVPPISQDAGQGFSGAVKKISGMLSDRYTVGVVVPLGASASALRLSIANHPGEIVTTHLVNPPPQ